MNLRNKRRELQGLNGAFGLVAGLGGYVGQLYSYGVATFLMLAIWIFGATLIILLTDSPGKGNVDPFVGYAKPQKKLLPFGGSA